MDITLYSTFDSPVVHRGLKIYPVTVKDYLLFLNFSRCLTIEKNVIPDAKIISMTNLEYIYYATEKTPEKTPYLIWLDRLLALCLRDDNSFTDIHDSMKRYGRDENGKAVFVVGEETYNYKDFEDIKQIICQQNLIELPDETISKEVRDSMERAREYKNKLSGTHPGTLEDYIISLATATGWTMEYIYSLTIRKFIKSIRRMDNLIHYKIYLSASMSGMVEFKDTSFIKHWLVDLDREDKYKDVHMDLDTIQGKVSLDSAKSAN